MHAFQGVGRQIVQLEAGLRVLIAAKRDFAALAGGFRKGRRGWNMDGSDSLLMTVGVANRLTIFLKK
jgi:hypothetical protein